MRSDAEISRCKCPRCVAARRAQLIVIAAICIIAGCSAYLALDLSHSKQFAFASLGSPPDTLPHTNTSAVTIETHPFQSPATRQNLQTLAKPSPQGSVSATPLNEPPPPQTVDIELSRGNYVTGTEQIAKQQENYGAPAQKTGELPAIPSIASAHQEPVPNALSTPTFDITSSRSQEGIPETREIAADAESLQHNKVTETEQITKQQENYGTPAQNTTEPPAIPPIAAAHQEPVPNPPSTPTIDITTNQSQEGAPKASEIAHHVDPSRHNDVTGTERIVEQQENYETPAQNATEPPAVPPIAGADEEPIPKAPSTPTIDITTNQSQERTPKASQIAPGADPSRYKNVNRTERIAKEQDNYGTTAQKTSEPPAIASLAGSHVPKALLAPTANVTLSASQERTRKPREIAVARSSANLYSSVPTPSPSSPPLHQRDEAEASVPPRPTETPAPLKSPTKERGEGNEIAGDLRRFAANYLRTDETGNVGAQERYYAGSVHFYGEGELSWARIAAATQRYHRNSPQRRYALSPASVRGPVDGGFWVIEQPFTWTKSDGVRVQTGRSVLRMRVLPAGHGNFKITSVEQVSK